MDIDGSTTSGEGTGRESATISITAVNDAPGGSSSRRRPTARPSRWRSTCKGTGLSVSDAEALAAVETATLAVSEGALTVDGGGSGVTNIAAAAPAR